MAGQMDAALTRAGAADVALTFALLIFSMITVAAGAYSPFLYFRF